MMKNLIIRNLVFSPLNKAAKWLMALAFIFVLLIFYAAFSHHTWLRLIITGVMVLGGVSIILFLRLLVLKEESKR